MKQFLKSHTLENFAQISFGNRNYAKFSIDYSSPNNISDTAKNNLEESIRIYNEEKTS